MAFPTGKKDAEKLIRKIRASKHVDDPASEISIDLANALKLISDELYSTPTHFVLELIQNADDNKYSPGVTAKLVFLYRDDGYLWVGCNESGFTKENVWSICRFHRSTKAIEEAKKGSIGEKGIGFKSAFKVADKVWIASGHFQFRFDRDAHLGIIAPVWDEETPKHPLIHGTTTMCFRIPDSDNRRLVQQHLRELAPELPLFLRNIRQIQVIFQNSSGKFTENYSLKREMSDEDAYDVKSVKRDHKKGSETILLRLIHVEYVAHSMPHETRRDGVENTKLQIEFPVTSEGTPELKNRQLYNSLPIRAYGLPFFLNADFLLSANREDVEHDNKWNEALLSATIELFVQSAHRFNREGIMRYTWPRYTKSLAATEGTVFKSFMPDLIKRLKQEMILESQADMLQSPTSLFHVPLQFTDGASPPVPLLDSQRNLQRFLATPYSHNDVSHLGVQTLGISVFVGDISEGLDGLRFYVQHHETHFRSRPGAWHSRVALAITENVPVKSVSDIKLVPLRDGQWVAAAKENLYFPELEEGLEIPPGLHVSVIHPAAAHDDCRRAMFDWLDAQDLDVEAVCELLLDEHANYSNGWDRKTVVSHAWYLFHACKARTIQGIRELRLAATNSPIFLKGNALYIDDGGKFSIANFIKNDPNMVSYVDRAYFTGQSSELRNEFTSWLKRSLYVQTIPRLRKDNTKDISEEFKYIFKNTSSRKFLTLLMACSDSYHFDFSVVEIVKTIKSTNVSCTNGSKSRLENTFLPLPALMHVPFAKDVLPFVKISDQDNHRWKSFSRFGVGTDPDLWFYSKLLSGLAQKPSLRPSKEEVAQIYQKIQDNWNHFNASAQSEFAKVPFIFIPSGVPRRWVKLTECVWQAPPQMRTITALLGHYPGLETLFVKHLGVQNASIANIVDELVGYSGQASRMADIKGLLQALNARLSQDIDHLSIDRLRGAKVFPVQLSTKETRLENCRSAIWCIADRDSLRTCFQGKLYLLDFLVIDVKEDGKLEPLLKRLNLVDRRLSGRVKESTLKSGAIGLDDELTDILKSKAKYIARLVSKTKRQAVLKQLTEIQVFSAENLTLRRSVSVGGSVITADDDGIVTMAKGSKGNACMYLKAEDIASNAIPLWQMQSQLRNFFEIPTAHESLIQNILGMNGEKQLEDMLERSGIDKDDVGPEQFEEELMSYAEPEESEKKPSKTSGTPQTSATSSAKSSAKLNGSGSVSLFHPRGNNQSQGSQSFAGGKPGRSFAIDKAKIVAAAGNFSSNRIKGFSTGLVDVRSSVSQAPSSSILSGSSGRKAIGRQNGQSSASESTYAFPNMSVIAQALPSITSTPGYGPRTPRPNRIATVPQEPEISGYDQDVGAAGEYFVYHVFKALFDIDDDAWTSNIRVRFGFPPMTTFEGDYADFTIESNTADKFTDWLVQGGHAEATEWKGKRIRYHVEVKTTTGGCNEAFAMSNNQFDLAQQWHESPTDVCILLRVFHFASTPEMHRFVDPYALHEAGKLKFQAQGFWVQPA